MTQIAIRLLGPLRVTVNDAPVSQFYSDKVRALLAYLAVEHDQPHRREHLAGLLWPNYPETSARRSLSQALAALRRALAGPGTPERSEEDSPWLIATREAIELCPSDACWTDAAELEALVEASRAHRHPDPILCPECSSRLQRAASLHTGEFLEGFSLRDSAAFEEWLVVRRERYRRRLIECLRGLSAEAEAHGDPHDGLAHARRWVELEPLDEEAHRQLMRLLAGCGRRAEALAQYGACRRILARELDVAPSPETARLYEAIRAGQRAR